MEYNRKLLLIIIIVNLIIISVGLFFFFNSDPSIHNEIEAHKLKLEQLMGKNKPPPPTVVATTPNPGGIKFVAGGPQTTWKYTNDPKDPDCASNWNYYNKDGKTFIDVIPNITKQNDTKYWCARKTVPLTPGQIPPPPGQPSFMDQFQNKITGFMSGNNVTPPTVQQPIIQQPIVQQQQPIVPPPSFMDQFGNKITGFMS